MKNLRLIVTTLALISLSNLLNAQAPNWVWAKSAGGIYDEFGYDVATDANGNVYMTGTFNGSTINFGTITLTNAAAYYSDIFIVKYNASGNVQWAKSEGGTSDDAGYSVSTDASGNVFITGKLNSNIFITKYDSSGNVIWVKSAGGVAADYGNSVATDDSGNVFITGMFNSPTITFGTTTLTNAGGEDIFIAKYDSGGNVIWAKSAGGIHHDDGISVATDAGGNVIITGWFKSPSITFGITTLTTGISVSNIFIVKYDAGGNVLWAKSAGGIDMDYGNSVATDANRNVYITGTFSSPTIIFGTTTLSNAGGSDIFIAKYDSSGNVLWAKSVGSSSDELGASIATDTSGNAFISAYFSSSSIAIGTATLTNAGGYDFFIAKFDTNGNVLWAKSAGGIGPEYCRSVATDLGGNVIITGNFRSSTIDFGVTTLTSTGPVSNHDIFIAKLDTAMTTGIESAVNTNDFSIYPNPANELLVIGYPLLGNKDATITILDITGKIIYTATASASQKTEVNTSNFAEGVYLVQVQAADFISTQKVVVAR